MQTKGYCVLLMRIPMTAIDVWNHWPFNTNLDKNYDAMCLVKGGSNTVVFS